jgi:NAD-dependent deacetylase
MNLIDALKSKAAITILTGAGISAESGLQTFRASDGLWEGRRVEDVATPEAFARNPALVHQFYNERRSGLLHPQIKPNAAHEALALLEKKWPQIGGGTIWVVTQNIDDLHERAGTQNLVHMHGELLKMFCANCARNVSYEKAEKFPITTDLQAHHVCKRCHMSGGLRPDIVWFGEMPYEMEKIQDILEDTDLFISIGTSGNVYPAAGFVSQAQFYGAMTMEINLEPSLNAANFHDGLYGPATEKVPQFVQKLLGA